jgi:hypothetical protein
LFAGEDRYTRAMGWTSSSGRGGRGARGTAGAGGSALRLRGSEDLARRPRSDGACARPSRQQALTGVIVETGAASEAPDGKAACASSTRSSTRRPLRGAARRAGRRRARLCPVGIALAAALRPARRRRARRLRADGARPRGLAPPPARRPLCWPRSPMPQRRCERWRAARRQPRPARLGSSASG